MSKLHAPFTAQVTRLVDHNPQFRELYLNVADRPDFQFRAGQFVMLQVPQPESPQQKPALRAYSLASKEQNPLEFRLLFKKIEGGVASDYVWALKGQEELKFTGPFGRVFFSEPPTEQILFLNTGSGLAQHLSYLESKAAQYPLTQFHMLIGLRYVSDLYYEKELQTLCQDLPNFTFEYVLSRPSPSWIGKKGYVQNFISQFNYLKVPTTFYLCGNGAMIKDVKHQLIEVDGLQKAQIHVEAFD